jgi:hypothetical protein
MYTSVEIIGIPPFPLKEGIPRVPWVVHFSLPRLVHYCFTSDIACVDGLKGFPEAIEAVFPRTQIQLCLVHMVRHSLKYVSWKQRKEVAADLKTI